MTCVCKDNNKCTCFTKIIQMHIFPHNHLENTKKASMVWYDDLSCSSNIEGSISYATAVQKTIYTSIVHKIEQKDNFYVQRLSLKFALRIAKCVL